MGWLARGAAVVASCRRHRCRRGAMWATPAKLQPRQAVDRKAWLTFAQSMGRSCHHRWNCLQQATARRQLKGQQEGAGARQMQGWYVLHSPRASAQSSAPPAASSSLAGQAVGGESGGFSMHASKQAPPQRSGWQRASGPHDMRRWHTSPLQLPSAWQAAGRGATLGGTRSRDTANVGIRLPLPPLLPAGLPCPGEPPPPPPPPVLCGLVPPGAWLPPGDIWRPTFSGTSGRVSCRG